MSVFDNVKCFYPLPTKRDLKDKTFQTKNTVLQATFSSYEIREDGTLWCEKFEIIKNPQATDNSKLSERYMRINHRWIFMSHFIGEIRFYTTYDSDKRYIEFSSYFVNGKLRELHLIKDEEL